MLDILALDLEPVAALDISQMPDGHGIKGTQVDTACMAQEMVDLPLKIYVMKTTEIRDLPPVCW
jgi:hypothetical protein